MFWDHTMFFAMTTKINSKVCLKCITKVFSSVFRGFMFVVLKSIVSKTEIKLILVCHKTAEQIQALLDCLKYFYSKRTRYCIR